MRLGVASISALWANIFQVAWGNGWQLPKGLCVSLCGQRCLMHAPSDIHRGDVEKAAIISEFRQDYENWQKLAAEGGHSAAMKSLLRRHTFETVSSQQMAECFKLVGWTADAQVLALLAKRCTGVLQTQVIEDTIGTQKTTSITNRGSGCASRSAACSRPCRRMS